MGSFRGKRAIGAAVVCIFISFVIMVFVLSLKVIQSNSNVNISMPYDLAGLQQLNRELAILKDQNFYALALLFSSLYILKQTFCIPGSIWLNLGAGSLFGVSVGFPLSCILTTLGASCCYWLSYLVFRRPVEYLFSKKIQMLHQKINREASNNLLWYLLFLRIVPFTPNWLLNLISPLVGVPFNLFIISVFFGLIPYNFMGVQTGTILADLSENDEVFGIWTILRLLSIAVSCLIFIILKNYFVKKNGSYDIRKHLSSEVIHLKTES